MARLDGDFVVIASEATPNGSWIAASLHSSR
jgi:hypothetical protein